MRRFPICALLLCPVWFAVANEQLPPIADLRTLAEVVDQPGSEERTFSIAEATIASPTTRLSDIFAADDGTAHLRITDGMFYPELTLKAGDRLRLSGVIIRQNNGLYNYAKATNVVILAHGTAPAPVPASAAEINAGRVLDRVVRMEGHVIDVFRDEIDSRFVFFVLADGNDIVYASLFADDPDTDDRPLFKLLDAVVRVTGLCTRQRPQGIGRALDITLSLGSPDAITTVTPPPSDPFAAPAFSGRIREAQRLPGIGTFRRKVRGTVIAVWGEATALVRTENNTLSKIGFATTALPACGDFIEAVGAPETDLYTLNLSRAIWRRATGTAAPMPPAESIPINQLFTDIFGNAAFRQAYHGQALKFSGRVRALPAIGSERLILECDGHALPVDFSAMPNALEGIEIGSAVEISGTCVMETENWRPQLPFPQIQGIFLAVRTPSDVRILARPSWWTPGRLLMIIAALAVALLVLLLRNILQARLARVRLDERTRLAVELHDTIAQNLTGASFEINAGERLVPTDSGAALKHLGRAARTLKSCRDELRNCIWDLRNQALDAPDMNAAIRRTLEPHVGNTSLAVRFNVPRTLFSDNSAHTLMRIIRELTLNAIRHGGAKSVKIAGSVEDRILHFSVRDDGCGFDPDNCPGLREGHFGLQGVRERIKKFNGKMTVDSHPGAGTRIAVSMVLSAGRRHEDMT